MWFEIQPQHWLIFRYTKNEMNLNNIIYNINNGTRFELPENIDAP